MYQVREIIAFLAIHHLGDWNKIYQSINNKETFDPEYMDKTLKSIECKYITILDEEYPPALKNIYQPPFVLFYYGNISYIQDISKIIGVVGSRDNSEYGKDMTERIVSGLASNYIIVSGLAKGIDAIAHKTAIVNGGKTIAVLGCGIELCYPNENQELYDDIKQNHLLISEYPFKTISDKNQFPMRNRIVSALSKALLVTEAYSRSGTLITIGFTLESGKDVYCVPYSANANSECNRLIKEGATMVESAEDVIYNLQK